MIHFERGLDLAEDLDDWDTVRMLSTNLAAVLIRAGRYDEALAVCDGVDGSHDSDMHAIRAIRARISLRTGDLIGARDLASQLPEAWPDSAFLLAFAYLGLGADSNARRWFAGAAAASPGAMAVLRHGRATTGGGLGCGIAAVVTEDAAAGPPSAQAWLAGMLA